MNYWRVNDYGVLVTASGPFVVSFPSQPVGGGGAVVRAHVIDTYDNPIRVPLTAFSPGNSLVVFVKGDLSAPPTHVTDDGDSSPNYELDSNSGDIDTGHYIRAYSRHDITNAPTEVEVHFGSAAVATVIVFELSGIALPDYLDAAPAAVREEGTSLSREFTSNYAGSLALAFLDFSEEDTITESNGWGVVSTTSDHDHAVFLENLGPAGVKSLDLTFSSNVMYGLMFVLYRTVPAEASEDSTNDEENSLSDSSSASVVHASRPVGEANAAAASQSSASTANSSEFENVFKSAQDSAATAGTAQRVETADADDTAQGESATVGVTQEASEAVEESEAHATLLSSVAEGSGLSSTVYAVYRVLVSLSDSADAEESGDSQVVAQAGTADARELSDDAEAQSAAISTVEDSSTTAETQGTEFLAVAGYAEVSSQAAAASALATAVATISASSGVEDTWAGQLVAVSQEQESVEPSEVVLGLSAGVSEVLESADAQEQNEASGTVQAGEAESVSLSSAVTEEGGVTFAGVEDTGELSEDTQSESLIGGNVEEADTVTTSTSSAATLVTNLAELSSSAELLSVVATYAAATVDALVQVDQLAAWVTKDAAIQHAQSCADSYVTLRLLAGGASEEVSLDSATHALALVLAYAVDAGVSEDTLYAIFGSVSEVDEATEELDLVRIARAVVEAQFVYIETDAYFEEVEHAHIDTWLLVADPGYACVVAATAADTVGVVYLPSHDDNSGVEDAPQFDRL